MNSRDCKRGAKGQPKVVKKDGKVFRWRRGKLVEIPPEWIGRVASRQNINNRASKQIHKHRKLVKYGEFTKRRAERKLLKNRDFENDE